MANLYYRNKACSTCPFRKSNLVDLMYGIEGLVLEESRQEEVAAGIDNGDYWICHSANKAHCAGAAKVLATKGHPVDRISDDPDLFETFEEWGTAMTALRERCIDEGIKWQ